MEILWFSAIGLSLGAGWSDWQSRRIPNWLTVSGFFLGAILNVMIFHMAGAKHAVEGAGMGLGLLLPIVLLRGLGAGDWKLMGALGAFLGPMRILFVLFGAVILAGITACVMVTRKRCWLSTLRNLRDLIFGFAIFGLRPNPQVQLGNSSLISLPFGSVVAFATPLCYFGIRLLVKV